MTQSVTEIYKRLRPFIQRQINEAGQGRRSVGAGTEFAVYVPLTTPLTSTAWDGDAYSTVGTSTLIDTSAVFGVPAGVKALSVQIVVKDSAAWGAGEYWLALGPSSGVYYMATVSCYGGDLLGRNNAIVNCDANGDIYYRIGASGAGTLDAWINVLGYWI